MVKQTALFEKYITQSRKEKSPQINIISVIKNPFNPCNLRNSRTPFPTTATPAAALPSPDQLLPMLDLTTAQRKIHQTFGLRLHIKTPCPPCRRENSSLLLQPWRWGNYLPAVMDYRDVFAGSGDCLPAASIGIFNPATVYGQF